jgi:hypothetical protein
VHLQQDFLQLFNETWGIDGMRTVPKFSQVPDRLFKLASCAGLVAPLQMMESNGCLYQSLIKNPEWTMGNSPEIFPVFVSLEVAPRVKKMKASFEKVRIRHDL